MEISMPNCILINGCPAENQLLSHLPCHSLTGRHPFYQLIAPILDYQAAEVLQHQKQMQ